MDATCNFFLSKILSLMIILSGIFVNCHRLMIMSRQIIIKGRVVDCKQNDCLFRIVSISLCYIFLVIFISCKNNIFSSHNLSFVCIPPRTAHESCIIHFSHFILLFSITPFPTLLFFYYF